MTTPPTRDLTAGTSVAGRWTIKRLIGKGASGEVYLAHDSELDSDVALKFFRLEAAQAKIWQTEIRASRSLQHENIVRIYDLHEFDQQMFVSMTYVEGVDLQRRLDDHAHASIGKETIFRILVDLARALDYLHSQGFVHRDVKPANTLLQMNGQQIAKAYLGDLGFAVRLSSIEPPHAFYGTHGFAAPEWSDANARIDHHADIFSLGRIAAAALHHVSTSIPGDPMLDGVRLDDIIEKACAVKPSERFDTAQEFVDAIGRTLGLLSGHLSPSTDLSAGPRSAKRGFSGFNGVCLYCKANLGPYDPWASRHCCTKGLEAHVHLLQRITREKELFPTIFPIPALWDNGSPIPHLDSLIDGLVVEGGALSLKSSGFAPLPCGHNPQISHLRCGNAVLHSLGHAAVLFDFAETTVEVCNMSTYYWSSTLKDPKSWAVVNAALANQVRHLGVWTAGNAGLSLAKIVNAVNCCLPPSERLNVYCYAYNGGLGEHAKKQLESLHATVQMIEKPPRGTAFSQRAVFSQLCARKGLRIDYHNFWDVTDGWDGLGVLMYRLIGRQLIAARKPGCLLMPVGTGSLFLGMILAKQDCVELGIIEEDSCVIYGAVPAAESIVENYGFYGIEVPCLGSDGKSPPAAKLRGVYSPLLVALLQPLLERVAKLVRVTEDEYKQTYAMLQCREGDPAWTSEPSALLTFAALNTIAKQYDAPVGRILEAQFPSDRVIVVNSGFGSLD